MQLTFSSSYGILPQMLPIAVDHHLVYVEVFVTADRGNLIDWFPVFIYCCVECNWESINFGLM